METKFERMACLAAQTKIYNIGEDRSEQEAELLRKIFWNVLYQNKVKVLRIKAKHKLQLKNIDNYLKTTSQKKHFIQSITEIPGPVFSIEFSDKDALTEPYYHDEYESFCCPCLLFVSGKEVGEQEDFIFGFYWIQTSPNGKLKPHVMASRLTLDSNGINYVQVQSIHAFLKLLKSKDLDACTYNGPLPNFKEMHSTWTLAKSLHP